MEFKKLKDLVEINSENITKNYKEQTINYLDTANITNGKIDKITELNIEKAPSRAKRIVRKNDIIYSTVRPNLCHYGILRKVLKNMIVSTGFIVLRCKEEILPEYLYAYITLPFITDKLNSIAETSTSAYPSIKPKDMANLEIALPPKEIQQKIANILSSIDKKIELNNHINNNLYEIVIQMYNNLFLNPEEWKEVKLNELGNISSGKRPNIKLEKGMYPIIGANGKMGYTSEYNFDKDIIITGRVGTLGVVKRYYKKIWASDNTLIIETKYKNYIENYLKTLDYSSLNRGSTQPLLTQTDLKNQQILFNDGLVSDFEFKAEKFVNKIRNNEAENEILEQLRDTLLPKLLNGEINLDKVEL